MIRKISLPRKNILRSFSAVSLFGFIFLVSHSIFALPNPAATYCERMGYEYKVVKTPEGEKDVCVVAEGVQFDAWDFFKGKAGQEYSYCAKQGYETQTESEDKGGFSTECAVCVSKSEEGNKTAQRIPLLKLMEDNGEPLMKTDPAGLSKKGGLECEGCQEQQKEQCDTCPNTKGTESKQGSTQKSTTYPKAALPDEFDWRDVAGKDYIGPVRNQGSCGSCYAFGAVASAEGVYNYAMGLYDDNRAEFSESFIMWCLGRVPEYIDNFYGCVGADYDYQELEALTTYGICSLADFPYTTVDPGECTHWDDPLTTFSEWDRIDCGDTEAIKTAIYTYGVIDVAVWAGDDFQDYDSGIYEDSNTFCSGTPCYETPANHAVALVGWDDTGDTPCWILRNSWGASWGESGYMRIAYTSAGVACEATYLNFGIPTSQGRIWLDKSSYSAPDTAIVTLWDTDLDTTGSPDTTTVEFTSDTEDVFPKTVTLTETDDSTGIFTGSIRLTNKFLGNILGENPTYIPANFGTYWNQVTPENAGKWGSVENTQDVMEWDNLDTVYNYAKDNDLPFKQHAFVWGSQQPGWIGSLPKEEQELFKALPPPEPKWMKMLSLEEQRTEVEEWIRLFGERYPDTDFIEVVNEPFNASPSYKDALGGDGETGWDWIIWSFQKARQYCPNAKLLINEWGVLEGWGSASIDDYLTIINLLNDRGLIDGIGNQCHDLQFANMTIVNNNLDALAATGLPVYITELNAVDDNDTDQLAVYLAKFPVLWEHPSIGGITLWGYIEGKMWDEQTDAYLMEDDETTERPALTWLKEYTSLPSGILRVKNGDTITVTYEDADDGTGDTALVTATAEIFSLGAPTRLTATAGPTYVFLYWNPVESPVFARYNVYRSISLAGEKTKINGDRLITSASYQDLSLSLNTTYYYWVTTLDIYGDETDYSNVAVATTGLSEGSDNNGNDGEDGGNGGGGSKAASLEGGCFIATACYGTPMASEVQALSAFRDEYLLNNFLGRFFVSAYYQLSPRMASFISEHPYLKSSVRWALKPIVRVTGEIVER